MLRVRLFTAFILILMLFWCVTFSRQEIIPVLFFMFGTCFAGTEFIAMRWHVIDGQAETERPHPMIRREHWGIGLCYALCIPIEFYGPRFLGHPSEFGASLVFAWIALCTICGSAFFYRREIDLEHSTHKLMNVLAGFVYISIPGVIMLRLSQIHIDQAPKGIALYFALACILLGDSGAYFVGRAFGRRKLIPKVSPKKTVEGAIGGLIFSALTGFFFCIYFIKELSPVWGLILALVIGAAGQVGDLAESALKRTANVKDSGSLLPGHGGMLDRIDSLLFGIPLAHLLFLSFHR
jgi:CDP-diglyceride synthetase